MPLVAFVVANQFPHLELDLTELGLLASVLLPDGAGIQITHEYLTGIKAEDERETTLSFWWNYVDGNDGIRKFKDKPFLIARLAICFLPQGM
ncbi:hypothetical protein WDV76_01380 [Xenorhabdus griffiniae]|uniref:hypothetical protein n=1 Tax=Xenorhabdus griffiniae TaxID=351672 RepID=UPI0030CF0FD2